MPKAPPFSRRPLSTLQGVVTLCAVGLVPPHSTQRVGKPPEMSSTVIQSTSPLLQDLSEPFIGYGTLVTFQDGMIVHTPDFPNEFLLQTHFLVAYLSLELEYNGTHWETTVLPKNS